VFNESRGDYSPSERVLRKVPKSGLQNRACHLVSLTCSQSSVSWFGRTKFNIFHHKKAFHQSTNTVQSLAPQILVAYMSDVGSSKLSCSFWWLRCRYGVSAGGWCHHYCSILQVNGRWKDGAVCSYLERPELEKKLQLRRLNSTRAANEEEVPLGASVG
jgi:hypothetical protein